MNFIMLRIHIYAEALERLHVCLNMYLVKKFQTKT